MKEGLTHLRVDKWLWAARFYKTRTLAAEACERGRVECNAVVAKASRMVKPGDRLRVTNEGGVYEVEVLGLSEMRGAAAVAQELYRESEESREARRRAQAERRAMLAADPMMAAGRPTKKDRRDIAKARGRIIRFG